MNSFCLGCGNSLTEGERFCGVCGRDSQAGASLPPVDPHVAFGLPPETSGKAIFSLICGIFFIILPLSVVAVIFGYIALSEILKGPGRLKGRALAITGIVFGYVGIACIVALFGVGIYGVRKAAKELNNTALSANKGSVVSSMRSLNMAEIAYGQAHQNAGFTCSLSELSGVWGISSDLAGGRQNGYIFELKNCSAVKPGGPIARYQVVAYPVEPRGAEVPAYCTDESDVIRVVKTGSPQDCFTTGTELSAQEVSSPQAPPK